MNEWSLLSLLAGLTCTAAFFIIYPLKGQVLARLFLIPIIFLTAFSGYYYWGGYSKWTHYLHYQEKKKQAQKVLQSINSPDELIKQLRAKLDTSPKSAKGWYLLGRLYSGQNNYQEATKAFATAYALNPNKEQYVVHYAHSLWQLNNQHFTPQITGIFRRLLKNNPDQPDALAMLAMNAYENHKDEVAISYWQRLLQLAPAESKEAQAIRKAIAKAEARIKLK